MRQVIAIASPPLARIASAASSHGASLRDEEEVVADAKALFLAVSLEHFLQGGDRLPTGWREYWGPPPDEEPQLPY